MITEPDGLRSIVAGDAALSVVGERDRDVVLGRDADHLSQRERQPDRRDRYFDLHRPTARASLRSSTHAPFDAIFFSGIIVVLLAAVT